MSGILSEKYEIKVLGAIACEIPASQCLQKVRNMDIDTIDEELLSLMKGAGCHTVMMGVESAEQEILDRYHKKITLKKIIGAFFLN